MAARKTPAARKRSLGRLYPAKGMYVSLIALGNSDFGEPVDIGVPAYWQPVRSLAEASRVVQQYIAAYNLGSGNWTGGQVIKDGVLVGRVSYNGRVWPAAAWAPGAQPLSECTPSPPRDVRRMLTRDRRGSR